MGRILRLRSPGVLAAKKRIYFQKPHEGRPRAGDAQGLVTGGQRRPSGGKKATSPGQRKPGPPVLGPDEGPGELLSKEAYGLDGPSGQVQGQWSLQLWGHSRCQRPSPTVRLAEKQHHRLKISHPRPAGLLLGARILEATYKEARTRTIGISFPAGQRGRRTCSPFSKIRKCDLTQSAVE